MQSAEAARTLEMSAILDDVLGAAEREALHDEGRQLRVGDAVGVAKDALTMARNRVSAES